MTNLILCGGIGTRLWPLSRQHVPKQFFPLFGGKSIFEETVERNRAVSDRFLVATNQSQYELARTLLAQSGDSATRFLIEPVGRNTAPAIALACFSLPPDEVVLVTPSDHRIGRPEEYQRAVARAKILAEQGFLVTFGIQPTYPETGFGYIEAHGEEVKSFREKPDASTAASYLSSGRHLWNSGMFVFQAKTYLEELKTHSPEIWTTCQAIGSLEPTLEAMQEIPSKSIDYAVMEKSNRVRVVRCDPGWSDLGSFDALFDEVQPKEEGNAFLGSPVPLVIDSRNSLVVSGGRKIVLVGVDDLIVVDTPDALLITKRGSSQRVKEVVDILQQTDGGLLE